MGVRGLTTYIANRSHIYLENYELINSHIVIDGNSVASQLYKLHCKCNDCFGGDYDKYAKVIKTFFESLLLCNVTPIIVYDGGYEKRKLRTVIDRLKTKVKNAYNLNSVTEGTCSQFPLFLREVFKDTVLALKIKCVRCEFEADGAIAHIAKKLNCPLLSYDSDFFIFDALYIPFPTLNINPERRYSKLNKRNEYFLNCRIYRIDIFLENFGGMDKANLPLLAILLGNDYIKRGQFAAFYKQLKLQKGRSCHSEQQRRIKTVISWLRNETFASAFQKILFRVKSVHRRNLKHRMEEAVQAYTDINSDILDFLGITFEMKMDSPLCQINSIGEESNLGEENPDDEETNSDVSDSENDESHMLIECIPQHSRKECLKHIPDFFRKKFIMCQYPPCFMDILTLNCYYCIPQVEDYRRTNSHSISLTILSTIHKILRGSSSEPLVYFARNENCDIKKFRLDAPQIELPYLYDIEGMQHEERLKLISKILNIENEFVEYLESFPSNWQLLLISLNYWMRNSKVEKSYLCSIILCAITLFYVDEKIGFCRSNKTFFSKYDTQLTELMTNNIKCIETDNLNCQDINSLIQNITYADSLLCMKYLISYFQMDLKMRSNLKLYDKIVVHDLCEFQSCLLHIKYLNCLLNFPFPDYCISNIFDGTFVYNMTINLQKRRDIDAYMKTFICNCPSIFNVFDVVSTGILKTHLNNGGEIIPNRTRNVKKRKRKKKNSDVVEEKKENSDAESDNVYDENNKFTVLSSLNK